jgi:hypothetical protein
MQTRVAPTLISGLVMFFMAIGSVTAQTYVTGTRNQSIKTVLVRPVNDWKAAPVINISGDDKIKVSFDELSHDYKRYAYRVIHCDRNWKRSNLNLLEYMEGFQENDIVAFGNSSNTLTNYTHYSFTLPNEQVSLKLSGNYAVEIIDRDDSKKVILTACFSVVESKTAIQGLITANTDVDTEQYHQQVQFAVKPLGWIIQQPESEISVRITQNQLNNTTVNDLVPDQIQPDKLVFEHDNKLVFEAGNEFRRFEITSFKHAGLGVNRIEYFAPYYNADLFEAKTRNKGYVFDKDQNGRFLVHNTDYALDETQSDYFLVHVSFPMEVPFQDERLYLFGDLVENKLDENSRMVYNRERKAYEKTLFLKQGSYNYTYVSVPSTENQQPVRFSSRQTEGSYWQTENEYQIYVYYRPMGSKYDQLIGFTTLHASF